MTNDAEFCQLEQSESIPREKGLSDHYKQALDKQLLLNSPMGIRIDFNITRSELELWLSPQAKQSVDYGMRNFSNRDDHTRIFDRIHFPGLNPAEYYSIDYDPFHSVVRYENTAIHIVPLVDDPAVLLWVEGDDYLVIDLKSDKQDTILEQSEGCFVMAHPDRGLDLEFAAAAGPGRGSYQHQRHTDDGRSTYARFRLMPDQLFVLGGELASEHVRDSCKTLATSPIQELINKNEERVQQATAPGHVLFRNRPDWQAQFDLNKRVLFSAEDHGGWIPAALRAIYYLCWHFDSAIISSFAAQCGWPEYLRKWTQFELLNPTETPGPVPGRFFGQLVTGKMSKQEEWGLYCAVWSAFTHWTQTGSTEFMQGKYKANILECLDWMERCAYDPNMGAFGFWYRGEEPFEDSYDYGFDEAVGKAVSGGCASFDRVPIRRSYNFAGNLLNYNAYIMLGAMLDGDERDPMFAKADALAIFLKRAIDENFSQLVRLADGTLRADPMPKGWKTGSMFSPDYSWVPTVLSEERVGKIDGIRNGEERFVHQVLLNYVMRDPAVMGSDDFVEFMDIFLPQCRRAGEYLQMPGTVIENVNCPDGSYHDNRPQVFATSLMNATMMGTALRRFPFGIAVRANNFVETITGYEYQGRTLKLEFAGAGPACSLTIGKTRLNRTLQVPEELLEQSNEITVEMHENSSGISWMGSSVRLLRADEEEDACRWHVQAYGRNAIFFDGRPAAIAIVQDEQEVPLRITQAHGWCYVDFDGNGEFSVSVSGNPSRPGIL